VSVCANAGGRAKRVTANVLASAASATAVHARQADALWPRESSPDVGRVVAGGLTNLATSHALSLTDSRDRWLPDLAKNRLGLGVNWSGLRAVGYDSIGKPSARIEAHVTRPAACASRDIRER
jgi:hypothetical protein